MNSLGQEQTKPLPTKYGMIDVPVYVLRSGKIKSARIRFSLFQTLLPLAGSSEAPKACPNS